MNNLTPRRVLQLSDFFKSLGDPTRVRIIDALSQDERNVGELARELNISPSALSHQLRILRSQGMVTYRREGRNAYYRLTDDSLMDVVRAGLTHCN